MVYVTTSTDAQSVYFPRNGWTASGTGEVTLEATSTSDLTEVSFSVSSWSLSGDYILAAVVAPSALFAGEWEYTMTLPDGNELTGLMTAEGEAVTTTEYNTEINYTQYGE